MDKYDADKDEDKNDNVDKTNLSKRWWKWCFDDSMRFEITATLSSCW